MMLPPRFPAAASLLLAAALLAAAPAFAECEILAGVINDRAEELHIFSTKNNEMMASLLAAEKSCKEQGAAISMRIAKAAESLTCQAQADAAEMNREMERVGRVCTEAFEKRHALQVVLHTDFSELENDVDDGVSYIVKSEILNEECADEVGSARKLYKATHVTEGNIVATELKALEGMRSYEEFRRTADEFRKKTEARNVACGQQPGSPGLPPLPAGAPGLGAPPMIAGTSPRSASDITGELNDPHLANFETAKIDRVKLGKGRDPAASGTRTAGAPGEPARNRPVGGHENAEYPEKAALDHYNRKTLQPQKATALSAAPSTAADSAVLAAWQFASAAPAENAPAADPKELARGPASVSDASASPPATAATAPAEIRFLGEVNEEGEATASSAGDPEKDLFARVKRAYRQREKALHYPLPTQLAHAE